MDSKYESLAVKLGVIDEVTPKCGCREEGVPVFDTQTIYINKLERTIVNLSIQMSEIKDELAGKKLDFDLACRETNRIENLFHKVCKECHTLEKIIDKLTEKETSK